MSPVPADPRTRERINLIAGRMLGALHRGVIQMEDIGDLAREISDALAAADAVLTPPAAPDTDDWAWYQAVKPTLGHADWQWNDEMQGHIPCCSQPKGTWRCGNGPLEGDAIFSGDCGESHEIIDAVVSPPDEYQQVGWVWVAASGVRFFHQPETQDPIHGAQPCAEAGCEPVYRRVVRDAD